MPFSLRGAQRAIATHFRKKPKKGGGFASMMLSPGSIVCFVSQLTEGAREGAGVLACRLALAIERRIVRVL